MSPSSRSTVMNAATPWTRRTATVCGRRSASRPTAGPAPWSSPETAPASAPALAAVNGPAIGAGTQLALACDLRVAAPAAAFAIPTARLGLAVDPWTIRRLAALAGGGTAQAVLIGCDTLDAAAALRCGLASRLGDRAAALAWARELAALAPLTLAYSKQVLNQASGSASGAAADSELIKAYEACWASDDCAEGQRARADKRPPRFQGR